MVSSDNVVQVSLTTISPLFLNGSDPKGHPELRAMSVRGQLRYWLRAIEGARSDDLTRLKTRESNLFGSTTLGSSVSIRLYSAHDLEDSRHEMLPHRSNERERGFTPAIDPDQTFTLQVVTRPGTAIPPRVIHAIQIWLLLGGLGKRSRRMFGALDSNMWEFTSSEHLASVLTDRLTKIVGQPQKISSVYAGMLPDFPTLNPAHCRVLVGHHSFDDARAANVALFKDFLRSPRYIGYADSFGYAKGNKRRASPLIAQVRRIGDKFFPVITVMRSTPGLPSGAAIDWTIYNRLLTDLQTAWKGEYVWGMAF
ncbi:MAG: type III-B CRISPR module RAMP protein Cmr1 [Chloroflexota bacterium]